MRKRPDDALTVFFEGYASGATKKARSRPASAELAELFAIAPSKELARFVDFLATHEREERYGGFGWFGEAGGTTIDWLPGRDNAVAHALAEPYRHPAALAGGLAIGTDHGGNVWVVALDAHRGKNAVFLVDSDEDEPQPVADSLETFARVMNILERGSPPTPGERKELAGRVRSSVLRDFFSGEFGAMARSSFTLATSFARRYRASQDLVSALASEDRSAAAKLRPPRKGPPVAPGEIVADLLRLVLRRDRAKLDEARKLHAAHRARFVRDAVRLLQGGSLPPSAPLRSARSRPKKATASARSAARSVVKEIALPSSAAAAVATAEELYVARKYPAARAAYARVPETVRKRVFAVASNYGYALQQCGKHREALASFEHAFAIRPTTVHLAKAMCFSHYALDQARDMLRCARLAVELAPGDDYAWQQVAIAWTMLDRPDEALPAAERAVAINPKNADARSVYESAKKDLAARR